MKALVIDGMGAAGFQLSLKLAQSGFDRVYYSNFFWSSIMHETRYAAIGEGFEDIGIHKVTTGFEVIDKADIIFIIEFLSDGKLSEAARKFKRKYRDNIVAAGPKGMLLETDRQFGMQIAKEAGFELPKYIIKNEIRNIKNKNNFPFVIKVDRFRDELETRLIAKKTDLDFLTKGTTPTPYPLKYYIMEYIKGLEFGVHFWFDGKRIWEPVVWTPELLSNSDNSAEEFYLLIGTIDVGENVLSKIKNLEKVLGEVGYIGPIDMNLIVTPDGKVYFLEFDARISVLFGFVYFHRADMLKIAEAQLSRKELFQDWLLHASIGSSICMKEGSWAKMRIKKYFGAKNKSGGAYPVSPYKNKNNLYAVSRDPFKELSLSVGVVGTGENITTASQNLEKVIQNVKQENCILPDVKSQKDKIQYIVKSLIDFSKYNSFELPKNWSGGFRKPEF